MPQLLVGFSAPLHDLRRDGLARHLLLLVGLLLPTVWVRVAAPKPTVACTHLRQRQELVPADAGGEQRAGEQLILAVDALALLRRDPALVDLRPRDLRERAAGEAPGSAAERSAEGAERGGGRTSGCGPRKRASSAIRSTQAVCQPREAVGWQPARAAADAHRRLGRRWRRRRLEADRDVRVAAERRQVLREIKVDDPWLDPRNS